MNIRTSLIAGLGLIAAGGLVAQTQAATTPATQAPASTNANSQPAAPSSAMPQSSGSQANNMPSASNASSGMSQQEVKSLQQALKGQGENVKSDGVWGPDTQAALKRYQQHNGLPATGQLDAATRSKLNLQG